MRKLILVVSLLMLAFLSADAQPAARIWGLVHDDSGKPLPSATVSLLKKGDSSLVKVDVSDATGLYEFTGIREGQYLVSVSSVNFAPLLSPSFLFTGAESLELPLLSMVPHSSSLAGVTVQSRRPLIETRIDRTVLNVDASPTNAGSSALEVLERSPGVGVDRDGNISLRGKQGVLVLMDGKQTYLSGQDLANLLRNLPASQLDQIEIITQPSAKYDAAGNSGVINLRTKKSLQRGFSGSVSLSYVQGVYPKSPNSANFNYRRGRINLFGNLGYSLWEGFTDQVLLRTFRNGAGQVSSVFDQVALQRSSSRNYSGRLGMDISLDKKTSIGFLVNGLSRPSEWSNHGRANIFNGQGGLDSFNVVFSDSRDQWKNLGSNVNFRRMLGANGSELTADLDYIHYQSRSRQVSDNYNYNPAGILLGYPFLLRGNLPSDINIYSGKIDYTHSLDAHTKVEAGLKRSHVSTHNIADYTRYQHSTSSWVPDYTRTNNFDYSEAISALYANYHRQAGKWGFQGGLRLEHTDAQGRQFGNPTQKDSMFQRNYTQLFPSAFISFAPGERHQFGLSYGRRIERPNYQDMNPFQYFLDQYTYRQGNPNLTPQFTHKIELSHTYRQSLTTTLSYSSTTDILNDVLKQDDVTKVTFQTKENVASRRVLGLAATYSKAVTPWWTTTVFANLNQNRYDGVVNNIPLHVNMTTFSANTSQQFRFAKTWVAEMSGFYRSTEQETGLFLIRPMGVVSFGISRQLMKNKATIKLNILDPFYIQRTNVDIKFGNIDAFVSNKWDNRRIGLNFVYRFSRGQGAQSSNRRTGSSHEEQSRVHPGQ